MSDRSLFVLTFGTALGCGLVGGVFFGFSSFVMQARAAPATGIAAMQAINVTARMSTAPSDGAAGSVPACGLLAR